jgi:hypothetical protein
MENGFRIAVHDPKAKTALAFTVPLLTIIHVSHHLLFSLRLLLHGLQGEVKEKFPLWYHERP